MITEESLDGLMRALEEQLRTANARYDLVVVGGSALEALGLVSRGTADVDVVALAEGETLIGADPLPQDLVAAVERVGRDFSLPATWLNPGPADLLQSGLPEGFLDRAVRRTYGPSLIVRYADRLDQIHLKLYAVVDRGPGRHLQDLTALTPNEEELLQAARWAITQDPSDGFRDGLGKVLVYFGVTDAWSRI